MNTEAEPDPSRPSPVTVLVVDDNQEFRTSLVNYLRREPEVRVIGQAESASEAYRLARQAKPELVLMDYSMPGENGIDACQQLKGCTPSPRVIVATMFDGKLFRDAALAAGADEFITKIELFDTLLPTIRRFFPRLQSGDAGPSPTEPETA